MDTDFRFCFAKHSNIRVHPWISVFIIFEPLRPWSMLQSKGVTLRSVSDGSKQDRLAAVDDDDRSDEKARGLGGKPQDDFRDIARFGDPP
jgi:hypothetical protein